MKKQLNVDRIQSELRGGSAFFPGYQGSPSPAPPAEPQEPQVSERSGEKANDRSVGRSFARTPVRDPARRIITRNSFEIYEDQMEALRKLSFQEKLAGKVGSMSAMVRAAIDSYLKEQDLRRPTASNSTVID
jgi:hypothetical protein